MNLTNLLSTGSKSFMGRQKYLVILQGFTDRPTILIHSFLYFKSTETHTKISCKGKANKYNFIKNIRTYRFQILATAFCAVRVCTTPQSKIFFRSKWNAKPNITQKGLLYNYPSFLLSGCVRDTLFILSKF